MTPYRAPSADFTFYCDLDLALTYALRRPSLALQILNETYLTCRARPDLQFQVRDLIAIIGGP